jgi:TetR/AcrR family fatty acid metabolism transcriptional regulator
MNSNNRLDSLKGRERSFIEEARRSQIIEATIDVLAKYGYVNTTFARIAAHVGISPSLISYHFTNKEELTLEVYRSINSARVASMIKSIEGHSSAAKMLHALLETDLIYMGTRPKLFKALVEALFSIRDSEGFLQLMSKDEQPAVSMVEQILRTGQKNGEFRSFDTYATALIIDGARDQFLAQLPSQPNYNLTMFTKTLIELVDSYILKERK